MNDLLLLQLACDYFFNRVNASFNIFNDALTRYYRTFVYHHFSTNNCTPSMLVLNTGFAC